MSITFSGPGFRSTIQNQSLYSDDTPMIKVPDFNDIINNANTMTLKPSGMAEFHNAMYLYDALASRGARNMTLVLPYIPGARQDRVNVEGDVLFTAQSVARDINARRFYEVIVLDPHSPVSFNAIDFAVEYPLSKVAAKMWQGYTGIIAADKGGKNRAEQFAKAMGKPVYYGGKTRDEKTGKLNGFTLQQLSGPGPGHFLVVDDICDGGGTFIGLAQKIREQGAYADLYVTHGIFAKGTSELKRHYKNIYTTDSYERFEKADAYTINVVEDMENYRG